MNGRFAKKRGILLDIACGGNKHKNFIGIDKRRLKGVDIVHDLEKFPWPIGKEEVIQALASHIIEHIKPWKFLDFMDEIWRIMKPGGQLFISMPYGVSGGFQQDPTHCNACNEATWTYFDPRYPLYNIYKPKPWNIDTLNWVPHGNMELVLSKVKNEKKKRT